jgi:hypothetical protein
MIYVLHRQVHVKLNFEASGWAEIRSIVASSLMHYNRPRQGRKDSQEWSRVDKFAARDVEVGTAVPQRTEVQMSAYTSTNA